MKMPGLDRKYLVIASVMLVLGLHGASSGQTPTITASTGSPLTAATLDGGQVALLLSGGAYVRNATDIRNAVAVSGIAGVTVDRINRLGDTAVTVTLAFSGYLAADGALTFTVGSRAIANYNGSALTAELPVAAVGVSLTASTPFGLWESTLNGSVVTLTLGGLSFERGDIRNFVAVSGLAGVTVDSQSGITRTSDTEVTVALIYLTDFVAPMAADGTLTFTVHAQAIANYDGPAVTAELPVTAGIGPFSHDPDKDFNSLSAAGNTFPKGIWSDGATMWVANFPDEKIYAYDLSTRARDPGKDFDTLKAARNDVPQGIWSDGVTMWAADSKREKIYAYSLFTKARDPEKDFDTLEAAENRDPAGIWSDGTTMWVANHRFDEKIYAYDLSTRARDPDKDFDTLEAAGNTAPRGIWSDGTTMWVADWLDQRIYAYTLFTRARDPDKDFDTLEAAGNARPWGLWSDGTTMWVTDTDDDKLYAYNMPSDLADAGVPDDTAAPDLVVQSPSVSDSSPTAGASFTLSAKVRNQGSGQSPATTLRFYRSIDGAISTSDTEVGSQPVSGLAGSGTSAQSTDLTAPSDAGTYYYGACVESVSGETDTGNNCSPAVAVTVGAPPETPAASGADFNGDGIVNFADFFDFVDAFGTTDAKYDLDGNGIVNFADFLEFVDAFGTSG